MVRYKPVFFCFCFFPPHFLKMWFNLTVFTDLYLSSRLCRSIGVITYIL